MIFVECIFEDSINDCLVHPVDAGSTIWIIAKDFLS